MLQEQNSKSKERLRLEEQRAKYEQKLREQKKRMKGGNVKGRSP